ncbi:SagB-type dehydrogenase domain-containing protein [Streptoalloteichus tenebrarius]|uniref:SagB-type dehydrogenase domain-containing protein n=1 Tax=Streptoalloteichus tenebrarius (strain ATCC 17920 / DSM 40477 / JCM 4838 / CBS 697.72 / NBRC 16177 / NCIMB 11028 / NRRL B-12390 / A12253. 1 / ISP 5477) TaxID=1933 RepID=A0ABT1HTX1_STRSD|nr:SagB/ThcOx family dehydrogenase [Streptoalloteichus tenebrarius]MCP2258976.1 SagB-type dehydrogenase domain-containing protein [Streptoalloteichus tenebrarius]BFF01185.1 SagB/ThcOx family dehydrogenase [Streptoalloteichus tenebrarius]
MRVKVAEYAALFYDRGRLVWDDYLHHRQFEMTEVAERVCRAFAEFADPDDVCAELAPEDAAAVRKVVDELVEAGVLVVEGSPEHGEEQALLAAWADWGPSARHFHFATRTLGDTRYASWTEQDAELDDKLATNPPPPPFKRIGTGPVELPKGNGLPAWANRPLLQVLLERRTSRRFGPEPLDLGELGHLLRIVGGPLPVRGAIGRSGTVLKTSPSGGGRHPVELYLHAQRVEGLEPGWYHYDAARHVLEPLGCAWTPEQVAASAGDQEWVGEAAAAIYYTAVLGRTRWKYDTARAYRVVQMDVGHLSQTAYLVATAMGLRIGFTAALRDELVEEVLGCDPHHEIVLGVTALGRPRRRR